MSNDGTLPQEILTDVLSRLPVNSLCRFKSVSRSWKTLISDPYFAKTHLNQTNTKNPKFLDQKIIIISSSHHLYSVDFAGVNLTATKLHFTDDNWIRVWNSCNGLILASHRVISSLYLLNPSTRECKKLPTFALYPGGFTVLFYDVGYDSSVDDYKVVALFSNGSDIMVLAVYSMKTNTWRTIQDSQHVPVRYSCGVIFNGCLHYRCSRSGSNVIVAFNFSDEIFREVPLPASLNGCEILEFRVAVARGCLSLVDMRICNQIAVWMMEEYGVGESWTKITIDFPVGTPKLSWLCQLAKDKFLFHDLRSENKLVVYDPEKETLRDTGVAGISSLTFGCTYVESLVSPNLGGGIGRQ